MEVFERQEKRFRPRKPHRSDHEIVKDILQFVASKYDCKTTDITFGAHLTYFQQKKCLSLLTDRGLILISSVSGYYKGYEISDLARKYLRLFADLEDDLRPTTAEKMITDSTQDMLSSIPAAAFF